MNLLLRYLVPLVAVVPITAGTTQAQGICAELHKCGWCTLTVSRKGPNSVVLNLEYANRFSLRSSGYIDTKKFPVWRFGPFGYNSSLSLFFWGSRYQVNSNMPLTKNWQMFMGELAKTVDTLAPLLGSGPTPYTRHSLAPKMRAASLKAM